MKTIATMLLLGGRPSLDLINTVDGRRDRWGPDLLVSYDDLLVWSARTGVLDASDIDAARSAAQADPAAAERAVTRLRTLREAIASVLGAVIEHGDVPDAPAAAFTEAVDAARRHQHLVFSGHAAAWAWTDEDPLDRVAHRVALDAAAILTDEASRTRTRICYGANCGWFFLDTTRNGSRRWCREEGCGTRTRVSRHRARNPGLTPPASAPARAPAAKPS